MATIGYVGTGSLGTGFLYIDDDGVNIRFYIRVGTASTNAANKGWSGVVNGGARSGSFSVNGSRDYLIHTEAVYSTQTVSFTMGATGTQGLGGPTTVSGTANRATVPSAPVMQYGGWTNPDQLTSTGMRVRFSGISDGGSPITEWQLQRATNAAFTTGVVTISSNGTSIITGLTPNTQYWWRARGANALGWGAWSSDLATAKTLDVPSKPALPVIASLSSTSLVLTTTDPAINGAAITAREVVLSAVPDFASTVATKTTASPTFATADGLVRNKLYYVRWRVQNSVGWSAWSDTRDVAVPGAAPAAPANYTVYDISATSAVVSLGTLSDNGGAVPSQVRAKVSTTASDTGLLFVMTEDQWVPVKLAALTKGTTYFVAEAAFNTAIGGGWGAYGAWVEFTTRADLPNAPVLALDAASATTATLEWAAPTQLNGAVVINYKLRVASDMALTQNAQEFTIPAGTVSRVIADLLPSSSYYAVIWTETDNGKGSTSWPLAFSTTGGGTSAMPFWLDVENVWKNVIEVWLNVDGVWKITEPWENVSNVWKAN